MHLHLQDQRPDARDIPRLPRSWRETVHRRDGRCRGPWRHLASRWRSRIECSVRIWLEVARSAASRAVVSSSALRMMMASGNAASGMRETKMPDCGKISTQAFVRQFQDRLADRRPADAVGKRDLGLRYRFAGPALQRHQLGAKIRIDSRRGGRGTRATRRGDGRRRGRSSRSSSSRVWACSLACSIDILVYELTRSKKKLANLPAKCCFVGGGGGYPAPLTKPARWRSPCASAAVSRSISRCACCADAACVVDGCRVHGRKLAARRQRTGQNDAVGADDFGRLRAADRALRIRRGEVPHCGGAVRKDFQPICHFLGDAEVAQAPSRHESRPSKPWCRARRSRPKQEMPPASLRHQ